MNSFSYYFSKLSKFLHPSSLKNCKKGKKTKLGHYSNLINVKIGDYSYLGDHNSICNTEIGAFCSIASFCSIGGGDHDYSRVSTSPIFEIGKNVFGISFGSLPKAQQKQVLIGNDVWIGEKVFIKPGISIGNGAVIGAHSVVTKDVPPYAIVAGVPARIIKYRFSNDVIEKLEQIKWWEKDEKTLKQIAVHFDDPASFINSIEESKNV